MQGILKSFNPKVRNDGTHDEFNGTYKFVVALEVSGITQRGEAGSKSTNGSKSWKLGKLHEFEKTENAYCENNTYFKGLKCIETEPLAQTTGKITQPAHDIVKESYVVSRFSHDAAIRYFDALPELEKAKKIAEESNTLYGQLEVTQINEMLINAGRQLIFKTAESFAKHVNDVALQVQKSHEGDGQTT